EIALDEDETHARKGGSNAGGVVDPGGMRVGENFCGSCAPAELFEVNLRACRIERRRERLEKIPGEHSGRLKCAPDSILDNRVFVAALNAVERGNKGFHCRFARTRW